MDEELLFKYIAGQAAGAEKKTVLDWLAEHPGNRMKFNRMKNAWVMSHLPETEASEAEVFRYSRRIRLHRRRRRIAWYGIAASVVLLLSFRVFEKLGHYRQEIAFLQSQQPVQLTYCTNKGVKGQVVLPDGSVVWLNADSRLECPARFSGDRREIRFSGEGYFNVVKNPEKPMLIRLDNGIQVLVKGTEFNLTSYPDDDEVSALLLSGHITVLRTDRARREEIQVKPHESVRLEKRERQPVSLTVPANTLPILGWKEGWLIFDETPVSEVLKKLERWHGISFEVHDPDLLKQKLTARFHQESISQILEMMTRVALLRFELKDKTAILYKY